MTRPLIALLLLLLAGLAQAGSLVARVDRSELRIDETLELTLEARDITAFGKPDLSPLNAQFVVSAPRQINGLSSVGNQVQTLTRWQVTLQPKITGQLEIPTLALDELHSEPILLRVADPERQEPAELAPVFIDASLDRDAVYVQAQALLTLRIYHSVSLYDDSNLSALQMDDALVERIGEPRTYERTLNGVRHGVIEVRYAVFPQRSGELTIPSQVFSAAIAGGSRYGAGASRLMQIKSPSIPLQVKPKPAEFPADAPWLPASDLRVNEAWNTRSEPQVGESITRSLMLKAEGLSAAQLPPIPPTRGANLRSYPDQPTLANETGEAGVIGVREQSEALVPSQAGDLVLPDTEIFWWNTRDDRLERATIAGHTLHIAANPELAAPLEANLQDTAGALQEMPLLWPWQLATALLALTSLSGFGLWWRARRLPAIQRAPSSGPSPRTLLDDLRRACSANDPQATRQALDAWARQQPETLADMAARNVPLSDALDGLNGALYSESNQQWQGQALWQAITALPAAPGAQNSAEAATLPPLYPR